MNQTFSKTCQIVNELGLHARAAAKILNLAEGFDAEITLEKDGMSAGGSSILGMMMLTASRDSEVTITATGSEAKEALESISSLIARGFDE